MKVPVLSFAPDGPQPLSTPDGASRAGAAAQPRSHERYVTRARFVELAEEASRLIGAVRGERDPEALTSLARAAGRLSRELETSSRADDVDPGCVHLLWRIVSRLDGAARQFARGLRTRRADYVDGAAASLAGIARDATELAERWNA